MARAPRKSGGKASPAKNIDAMVRDLQARILDCAPPAPSPRWARVNAFLAELQRAPGPRAVRSPFLIPLA